MKFHVALITAKIVDSLIKLLSLGAGSTWPGHIALALYPHMLNKLTNSSNTKIILVAGTNGKTTTSLIIKSILEQSNLQVVHNQEGANLENGIVTTFIRNTNFLGQSHADAAIIEVDENTFPHILRRITPHGIILLNLFRDQLDRYGEVDIIAHKWKRALSNLSKDTTLVFNADDPQVAHVVATSKAQIIAFTIDDEYITKKEQSHDVDSTYCPSCGGKLVYKAYAYSHLGMYLCKKCAFARPKKTYDYSHFLSYSHLKGMYNMYNMSAAISLVKSVFTTIDADVIKALKEMKPAFGRQEIIAYKGRNVLMLLSKNPVGFNQSLFVANNVLKDKDNQVLICLNDRIPDGRDISWIWDVDFENLYTPSRPIYVSGDRAVDMGTRLQYCMNKSIKPVKSESYINIGNIHVYLKLYEAIETAIQHTKKGRTLVVMATYSAMLEVREMLVGRKLL